jgi:hypothetical protein
MDKHHHLNLAALGQLGTKTHLILKVVVQATLQFWQQIPRASMEGFWKLRLIDGDLQV